MKLLALAAYCRHKDRSIKTLQPAMQLAAKTTDSMEMEELRREIRENRFRDATTLGEIEAKLTISNKAMEEERRRTAHALGHY